MAETVKPKVKMITVGKRECILTEDHCIPFDMVTRIAWSSRFETLVPDTAPVEVPVARIYTGTETEGIPVVGDEAKQLKKILSIG